MTVVYQYSSTRISGGVATANDVRHVTGSDIITGDMFYACLAFSCFFSYYSSTKCTRATGNDQKVMWSREGSPWERCVHAQPEVFVTWSDVIKRHVTPFDSLGRVGACMSYRILRNIRSNVTRRASPGKYGSVHGQPEVHLGCSVGHPRPVIVLYPFLWLSAPFPQFISAFNNGFHLRCFRICWRFHGRKETWIEIRFGKYGRKVSWKVKRYENYGRK